MHQFHRINAGKRLPNARHAAVYVVVIGQHQEVKPRVLNGSEKGLRRVVVVLTVNFVLLPCVRCRVAYHCLQIADGQIRSGKYGAYKLKYVVKIRLAVDVVRAVELLLHQHIAHTVDHGAAGGR